MRVTSDIDRQLLADIVTLTGEKSTSAAVRHALEDYVRYQRLERLWQLRGKVDIEPDWRKLRQGETEGERSCREFPPFTVRKAQLKWLREAARKGRRTHKPRSP